VPTPGQLPPRWQVRADFDEQTLVVYQAYPLRIARPAVSAQTLVAPFKRDRMTWIKPSFLWMMYRSGWASKPDQERVLGIRISRGGFEWALEHSALSHYVPELYANYEAWEAQKASSPVRIQWDPERTIHGDPLPYRAIQVGLSGEAVRRYVTEWITEVRDLTEVVMDLREHLRAGQLDDVFQCLPQELPLPLPSAVAAVVGAENPICGAVPERSPLRPRSPSD